MILKILTVVGLLLLVVLVLVGAFVAMIAWNFWRAHVRRWCLTCGRNAWMMPFCRGHFDAVVAAAHAGTCDTDELRKQRLSAETPTVFVCTRCDTIFELQPGS